LRHWARGSGGYDPAPYRDGIWRQGGVYHRYAKRYKELLAREGVTLEERMTAGAEEI
jgi:hypothetical protein